MRHSPGDRPELVELSEVPPGWAFRGHSFKSQSKSVPVSSSPEFANRIASPEQSAQAVLAGGTEVDVIREIVEAVGTDSRISTALVYTAEYVDLTTAVGVWSWLTSEPRLGNAERRRLYALVCMRLLDSPAPPPPTQESRQSDVLSGLLGGGESGRSSQSLSELLALRLLGDSNRGDGSLAPALISALGESNTRTYEVLLQQLQERAQQQR